MVEVSVQGKPGDRDQEDPAECIEDPLYSSSGQTQVGNPQKDTEATIWILLKRFINQPIIPLNISVQISVGNNCLAA